MCDIWKGNRNLKQLTTADIESLLDALTKFGTQQVVMSGGEALLNTNFFRLCEILKEIPVRITLLSTGLTLAHHAEKITDWIDEVIISLDGDETLHDEIRNIPGAFAKTRAGVQVLKQLKPELPVSARTVIHKLNFRKWPAIIDAAREMGLDRISFLPADTSSHAFNRETLWDKERQLEILPAEAELAELEQVIGHIVSKYEPLFENGFIAESPAKLKKILEHYGAAYGRNPFPYKKCNAPWVSTVIEADGTVRPCFFHEAIGNIRQDGFEQVINGAKAKKFRRELDIQCNETCIKCVCYLNLSPRMAVV